MKKPPRQQRDTATQHSPAPRILVSITHQNPPNQWQSQYGSIADYAVINQENSMEFIA